MTRIIRLLISCGTIQNRQLKYTLLRGKSKNFNIVIKCHSMKNQYYNQIAIQFLFIPIKLARSLHEKNNPSLIFTKVFIAFCTKTAWPMTFFQFLQQIQMLDRRKHSNHEQSSGTLLYFPPCLHSDLVYRPQPRFQYYQYLIKNGVFVTAIQLDH